MRKKEVTGRRGRRCKQQQLDGIKETRSYWELQEAPDRPLKKSRLGNGHGSVVRENS
jgi:hypothetical protein